MLENAALIAFVPTRDPARARQFYEQTLGLEFVSEDSFAVVFRAGGVTLRIANVSNVLNFNPVPFTILGWQVPSAETTVRTLTEKGINFERYPGLDQNTV